MGCSFAAQQHKNHIGAPDYPTVCCLATRAVALGATGRLYVGVNLEFPGLPLHHSVHAEQFLIANAVQAGESALTRLAVSAVPCGHCRQFCSELACAVRRQIPTVLCLPQLQ